MFLSVHFLVRLHVFLACFLPCSSYQSMRALPSLILAFSSLPLEDHFTPSYFLSSPWLTDRRDALRSQPGTLENVPFPGLTRKEMEQPVWLWMAMVVTDLVDAGTEKSVPWESCRSCSLRAGSTASLIPRAVRWLGLLSHHPPGGVLALPHPCVRGAGRELSLRPGLPETDAQVGCDRGGGGGIWSRGKPHPDRWPDQNWLWQLTPTHWNSISAWDQPSLSMPSFMVVWETRDPWTSGLVSLTAWWLFVKYVGHMRQPSECNPDCRTVWFLTAFLPNNACFAGLKRYTTLSFPTSTCRLHRTVYPWLNKCYSSPSFIRQYK